MYYRINWDPGKRHWNVYIDKSGTKAERVFTPQEVYIHVPSVLKQNPGESRPVASLFVEGFATLSENRLDIY